jgi:hypothetical protein
MKCWIRKIRKKHDEKVNSLRGPENLKDRVRPVWNWFQGPDWQIDEVIKLKSVKKSVTKPYFSHYNSYIITEWI